MCHWRWNLKLLNFFCFIFHEYMQNLYSAILFYFFFQEKDKLVAEVIRYVLFKTYQTAGCPIKREELAQIVTKNYRQRALPGLVISEAKEKLSSVFGYEMRELQRLRPLSRSTRSSQQCRWYNVVIYIWFYIIKHLRLMIYNLQYNDLKFSL